jgi:ATP-dependent Clp protease ATP-binding subunit ClpA
VTASAATLEQLAGGIVRSADAEEALRALTALRRELELIEPDLVRRAVQGGASWSQIAQALGVSKQAAHKKHREAIEQAAETEQPAPKILVTAEARRSIQLARAEARKLGQQMVGTEHLLLGILRCDKSHAVDALSALGVTLERARGSLQPTIVDITSEPPGQPPEGDKDITPHARRILEGSLREAVRRREGYIGVEHLLLALLTDRRNGAVQTLKMLKATPVAIRKQLDAQWEAQAHDGGASSAPGRARAPQA